MLLGKSKVKNCSTLFKVENFGYRMILRIYFTLRNEQKIWKFKKFVKLKKKVKQSM
jgi:hypothetical protein